MHIAFEQFGAVTGTHEVFFRDNNNNGVRDPDETYRYVFFGN